MNILFPGVLRCMLVLSLSVILIASCKRKISYSGTVYSRHHVPTPGARLAFGFSIGSKDVPQRHVEVESDENGNFAVKDRLPYNASIHELFVYHADSGTVHYHRTAISYGEGMEINLE